MGKIREWWRQGRDRARRIEDINRRDTQRQEMFDQRRQQGALR